MSRVSPLRRKRRGERVDPSLGYNMACGAVVEFWRSGNAYRFPDLRNYLFERWRNSGRPIPPSFILQQRGFIRYDMLSFGEEDYYLMRLVFKTTTKDGLEDTWKTEPW